MGGRDHRTRQTWRSQGPLAACLVLVAGIGLVVAVMLAEQRRSTDEVKILIAEHAMPVTDREKGPARPAGEEGAGSAADSGAMAALATAMVATKPSANAGTMPAGPWSDCPGCPVMVTVPPGAFTMGSAAADPDASDQERPQRRVAIAYSFAVSRHPITFTDWRMCIDAGGCKGHMPDSEGWGRAERPVINVDWHDAKAYVRWLSKKTGKAYRLPSEAEWEYAARGGTTTAYWWGDDIGRGNANCRGCGAGLGSQTTPIGTFQQNPFGLFDVHGNVWEWVEDCWRPGYRSAPRDGSAWSPRGKCERRVIRGGSWDNTPSLTRAAARTWARPAYRNDITGFRVVRELPAEAENGEP